VYLNILPNDFVWDDAGQVAENPFIRQWRNLPLFFTSGTFYSGEAKPSGPFYRPLVSFFYLLNYSVFGLRPFGFHLFQIFIHLLNSVLMFFIVERIFFLGRIKNPQEIAFLAAIIFAIHPANVESVAFVGSIGEILYTFFGLGSILTLIFGLNWQDKTIKNRFLILSFFLALLSLFSKESGIIILPLSFLYLLINFRPKLIQYLKWLFGLAVTFGIYFVFRFDIAKIAVARSHLAPISEADFFERLMTIPAEILYYFKVIFFPLYLSISQHFVISSIKYFSLFGFLFFLILSAIGLLLWKKKSGALIFLLLWFFVSLAPVLNIVPVTATVAERWLYFPIIGAFSFIGFLIVQLREKIKSPKMLPVFYIILSLLIIALGVRTIIRNGNWKDDFTLYSHDIKYSKQSFELENNYGIVLIQIGKYKEAERHLQMAVQLQKKNPHPYAGLGMLYTKTGDIEKAIEYYHKSIERGDMYGVYENLGSILVQQKKWEEAENFLNKGIIKFPKDPNLKWLLALVCRHKGEMSQAEFLLKEALKDAPENEVANHFLQLIKDRKF